MARGNQKMKKKKKVLLLFNNPYPKPRGYDYKEEFADPDNMYTEKDVCQALRSNGYTVSLLGICDDVRIFFEEIKECRPDVIFNMVEVFNNKSRFEKNIASLLEMSGIPYTGASSATLFVCNDKALSKKILRFHRLRGPRFYTFYKDLRIWLPRTLKLPCVVKPLCEEASRGISQASVVDKEDAFIERIKFIHQKMNVDAIAEEYIEGRELYVSVIGNKRIIVLPPREMIFAQVPEHEPRIATYKAKWDDEYRNRWGIKSVFAKLQEDVETKVKEVCKRAYRALNMHNYARFDIRLTPAGQVCIIEPNANPCIAKIDEVAQSAAKVGISYNVLIKKIVTLAFQREQ